MLGLLSDLPRKNCRRFAEWAGEADRCGVQYMLCRDETGELCVPRVWTRDHACCRDAGLGEDTYLAHLATGTELMRQTSPAP